MIRWTALVVVFPVLLAPLAILSFPAADSWAPTTYLKASNTDPGDQFGFSVAVSGDILAVGATAEAGGLPGINPNGADNSAPNAGAVYIYARSAGAWTLDAYLKAFNPGADDQFGAAVALSGDTLVVGAPGEDSSVTGVNSGPDDNAASGAGAAYVFRRSGGGVWSQEAYLKASNTDPGDQFGTSVAISGDTIVIGAYGEDSSATGIDGNQASNVAQMAGAAYVFTRTGTTWSQQAYLKASNTNPQDSFGISVSLDGDTLVVGASGEASSATGVNGNQADNTQPSSGAAYVFVRSGAAWTQQAYLKASNTQTNDFFGWSLAVSNDTVVIGARGEDSSATGVNGDESDNSSSFAGAAYVFVRSGANWSQQAYLKAGNTGAGDEFASAVGISGDWILVGAHWEDSNATGVNGNAANNSALSSGAAYAFVRSGADWRQAAYLKATNTDSADHFGWAVAIAGETLLVGARTEASQATGVNGDQADDTAPGAGAGYVYQAVRQVFLPITIR